MVEHHDGADGFLSGDEVTLGEGKGVSLRGEYDSDPEPGVQSNDVSLCSRLVVKC